MGFDFKLYHHHHTLVEQKERIFFSIDVTPKKTHTKQETRNKKLA